MHEIEWKNNGFLFTTPNIMIYNDIYLARNDSIRCRFDINSMSHFLLDSAFIYF